MSKEVPQFIERMIRAVNILGKPHERDSSSGRRFRESRAQNYALRILTNNKTRNSASLWEQVSFRLIILS